ncbi:MAG: DUF2304 family protein [Patescibacteria group bacterium]
MLLLFQLLFSLFALIAIVGVIHRRKDGLLSFRGMCFWILFWCLAAVIVVWPEITSRLAEIFGIQRGVDVVLYVAVTVIFYVLFRLHIKLEAMNRDVTKVVRKEAIGEEMKKK